MDRLSKLTSKQNRALNRTLKNPIYYSDRKDIWNYEVVNGLLVIYIYDSSWRSFVDITISKKGKIISKVEAEPPAFVV